MKPTPELINDWHEKARQMAIQADGYFDDVEHWRHFAELAAAWGAKQAQQTTEPEAWSIPEWSKQDDLGGRVPSDVRVALNEAHRAGVRAGMARGQTLQALQRGFEKVLADPEKHGLDLGEKQ